MTVAWSPVDHLEQHHEGWRIEVTELEGPYELFVPAAKLILLDRWAFQVNHRFLMAHSVAHVELHPEDLERLNVNQEDEADWLARLWTSTGRGPSLN